MSRGLINVVLFKYYAHFGMIFLSCADLFGSSHVSGNLLIRAKLHTKTTLHFLDELLVYLYCHSDY